jgi:hypothetical protein
LHMSFSGTYSIYSSLVFRYFVLDNFKTSPISNSFLQNLQTDFNTARKAGVKLIPRFAYTIAFNSPPYGDATKSIVLSHIEQLKPYLQANSDVIAALQMGFIGTWGENYYTDHFGDASISPYTLTSSNWNDRKQVLDSLLAAVPKDINVQVRYPQMKQKDVYGAAASVSSAALTQAEAYLGSNKSRIGFHNDCFLANYDDSGTYANYDNGNSDTTVLKPYKAMDSKYVMVGGETCSPSTFGTCSNALFEMNRMHYTYLNADYNNIVNNEWVTGNCINDINRNLGYRLYLTSGEYSNIVQQGSNFNYTLNITNIGFAPPINKRKVLLILMNMTTSEEFQVELSDDPRYWFKGSHTISGSVCIPECMGAGNYKLFLRLADPALSLATRPEYSIRLANVGTWVAAKGYNDLMHTLTISTGTGTCNNNKFSKSLPNKWIGPSNTNWNASVSNWSLGAFPDYCEDVIIEANKVVIVPSGYFAKARSVLITSGGNLKVLNGGLLDVEK